MSEKKKKRKGSSQVGREKFGGTTYLVPPQVWKRKRTRNPNLAKNLRVRS